MIPKTDGDATPLGQRPLSVLPIVYRIWASVRMGQLDGWFQSWVPDSVFSCGGWRGSVEAWYTSSLDIEEVLAGAADSHVHLFVADVVKSFDTVDRVILDCVLSRLGLPGWFRHAYFEYHAHVRLRFKLASGLGEPWTRNGGIPQACPLSMMFIVALYLPWCRYLAAQVGVQPQLYADNLKCLSRNPDLLLSAAWFTTRYVRLVGQEPAPSKCVLLSTSREVRKDMKDWVLSLEGDKWSVKFDVRDLRGHLDTTFRGWSSTLAARVRLVISRLALVFVLPLDFHGRVRVIRSMYLPAALHGIQASLLASESLRRLRSAVRRVVWSRRQPLASVGAVLSLLDGPTGCDPAFCVVWFGFRLLRRYLELWPTEVGRVYRLLEMVGKGCPGHGPIHLLSASATEIGFKWDPLALAWSRPGYPFLVTWLVLFSTSRLLFLMLGVTRLLLIFVVVRVFVVVLCWIFMALCSSLILLMFGKEIRLCFAASWLVVYGMVCFLVGCVVRRFLVGSVVFLFLTMMVTFFGIALFLLSLRFLKILSFMIS